MRIPTTKKFWFTIEKLNKDNGLYFYKMKDLKGVIIFGYVLCVRLFGKNIF